VPAFFPLLPADSLGHFLMSKKRLREVECLRLDITCLKRRLYTWTRF
jgi:hypothetical protein